MKKNSNRKPRPQQYNKRQRRLLPAVATMLVLGAPLAAQAQPTILNGGESLTGALNGGGTQSGYMLLTGSATVSNAVVSNYVTRGGNGSGGGAGLGGAFFVNEGASLTLNNVTFIGNTVWGGNGGTPGLLTGGSLNGLTTTQAAAGANGTKIDDNFVKFGDGGGNGMPGTIGFNGTNGTTNMQAGGVGGSGGTGQEGWSTNPALIQATVQTSLALASALLHLGAATAVAAGDCGNPFTLSGCPGNLAEAAATVIDIVNATVDVATAATQLGIWQASSTAGTVGYGGDGGTGGNGGNGAFGAGGGAGGNGGHGSDGGGAAHDGFGGGGGTGGIGGFGAGGGSGGDGGTSAYIIGAAGGGGGAGWGGGAGSSGSGLSLVAADDGGGGGGAALGGAIFVREGGTLTITGNARFVGNNTFGGNSANGGAVGDYAGTDIFAMHGSTIIFDPGTGNRIEFIGGVNSPSLIADDTKGKDYAGAELTAGDGAIVQIRSGLVIISGLTSYSGETQLQGGVLRADEGTGLSTYSNLNFSGGILETTGDFIRVLGTQPTFVQWTGSGGFSAKGGDLNVNLDGGRELTIGVGGFGIAGAALLFGTQWSDSAVHWANAINNNGNDLNILATANTSNADNGFATANINTTFMDGAIRGSGGLNINDATHTGTVVLTAVNTYTGVTNINNGLVKLTGDGSIANSVQVNVLAGATFDFADANADVSLKSLGGGGNVVMGDNSLTLTAAAGTFGGVLSGNGGLTIAAGTETLTGTNTYTGLTDVQAGARLNLTGTGSIATSAGVNVDGTFDISGTSAGARITTLSGAGSVVLGSQRLTLTAADDTFDGVISGAGGITVAAGTETLTGTNTFTGRTIINTGAQLNLSGTGSVATSVGVTANGTFDISATTAGARIITLDGNGRVVLGSQRLTLTNASETFNGVISGAGGITVAAGTETLTGTNTFTGRTIIDTGAQLNLSGTGSVATSVGVTANGTFDISATSAGARIITLDGAGSVVLGNQRLTLTNASETFTGVISGAGRITVAAGHETLTGTNTFTGRTIIDTGATLNLTGTGSVATSVGVTANGLFDISGTTAGASIITLDGNGTVALGAQRLTLTNASETFNGVINGTGGGITVAAGTEGLTGTNTFTGRTIINSGAQLNLIGTGSIATSSGVTDNGTFDISATTAGASIKTLDGNGSVVLGNQRLTLTAASETFNGVISGVGGGITVAAGTETLTGTNTFTGSAIIDSGAQLNLTGTGSIATASKVTNNGTFDISGTTAGASIKSLDGNGTTTLGDQALTFTNAFTTFAGVIQGTGPINVTGGNQGLSGVNTFSGLTTIAGGATLSLIGTGGISSSSKVVDHGTFDISATTAGARIQNLSGDGSVVLGNQNLTITSPSGSFEGVVSGVGGSLSFTSGSYTLNGANTYTGGTLVQNSVLSVSNDGNLGGVAGALTMNNGTLTNLSSTLNLARNIVLTGQGTLNTALNVINASGNISGAGLLVADGGGRLNLTGNNSGLTGGIKVINHTTLGANSDAALGAPNAPLIIESGKLVATGSFSTTRPITVGVDGSIDSNGNSLGLNTPITLVSPTGGTPITLALTGSAAITGPWTVDVSGLHVNSTADLHGVGVVGVPTFITGSLSPGNSPGTMVFTAPVTLTSTATLNIDIDGAGTANGAGNYDRVVVMGAANTFTAAGDLVLRLRGIAGDATNTYTPPVGTAFQVVVAQGGVLGTFNPIAQPTSGLLTGSRLDVLYQAQTITVYATPANYQNLTPFNVGLSANQYSTAGSLNALRPVPGVRTNVDATYALGRIFTQTPQALPSVLDHLGGTAYGDALLAGVERSRMFGGAISDQMEARRGGVLGAKSEVAKGDGYSAWLTALGQTYRVGAGSATAFHSGAGGVAVGADMKVKDQGLVGVAAGFTSGNVSSPATGGTVGLDTMHLVAYGSWNFASDYFIDGQLGTTRGDVMARRNLGVVGLTAKGHGEGWGVNGSAMVGARYEVSGIRLQPEFGFRFDEMGRGALTETAGGAVSLAVRSDSATSARAILGIRAQTSFDLGDGYGLSPNARLHYAHELADDTTRTTANFTGAPSAAMVNTSAKAGRDAGIVGVGASLSMPYGIAAYANYAAEVRRNVTGQAFTGGFRFNW